MVSHHITKVAVVSHHVPEVAVVSHHVLAIDSAAFWGTRWGGQGHQVGRLQGHPVGGSQGRSGDVLGMLWGGPGTASGRCTQTIRLARC